MKSLSVILTMVLLVLADRLAQHLKKTNASPAQTEPQRGLVGLSPAASAARTSSMSCRTVTL
jgi:hypothetical protein